MTTPISILSLDPNPWQTRPIDDAHAIVLAADIKANGLLQPPVARPHPLDRGRYQLALGHHRHAACARLAQADKKWGTMPVEVRDLTDIEMADIAIAENEKRKPLSPIEKANALSRLIHDFKLSQEQAGQRFGLTQAAVSHLLRLLKLPASIQALTDGARLPERHARQLVTLSKSLPNQAEAVAKKVAEAAPEEKDDTFDSAVRSVLITHGRQMYNPPFKTDESLPLEHVAKPAAKMGFGELPKCKGCEFFLERDRVNYCARPGCYDIKRAAAQWKAVDGAAKKLGLAPSQSGEVGQIIFDGDDSQIALARAALKAKHESLRLVLSPRADKDIWQSDARARKDLLGLHWFALASTDLAALKKSLPVEAVKQAAAPALTPAEKHAERERRYKADAAKRAAEIKEQKRLRESLARVIAPLLPRHAGILDLIAQSEYGYGVKPNATLAEQKATAAQALIEAYLNSDGMDAVRANQPKGESAPVWNTPAFTQRALTLLAAQLKLQLPADFAPILSTQNRANGSTPNGHAKKESTRPPKGVSTGKLSRRAKAQAAKPVVAKKGKRR